MSLGDIMGNLRERRELGKIMSIRKKVEPILATLVTVFAVLGFTFSCTVNSSSSKRAQQGDNKPRETPIPLQPTEANKGKRCAPRVYTDVGGDEDYNLFCYKLQRRLVNAVHEGNLDEMREALKEGANPDGSIYSFYYPPLFTAADGGQSDAARLLLDNGSNVNQGDFINGTPLIVAAGKGYAEVVKVLLDRGADPCVHVDGGTAEDFARKQGHKEIVELLKTSKSAKCK